MSQRLGELLLEQGTLSPDQLRIALLEQAELKAPLGNTLLQLGFMSPAQLLNALQAHLGFPVITLPELLRQAPATDLLPETLIRTEQVWPFLHPESGQTLRVAMRDPQDMLKLDRLQRHLPHHWQIHPLLASEADLESVLRERLPGITPLEDWLCRLEDQGTAEQNGTCVIHAVDSLLQDAIQLGASDIHFEPEPHCLRIRLRLDGHLQTRRLLRLKTWPPLLVRLKLLGGLDISETRQAQDGRYTLAHAGHTVDIRMSAMPTRCGETLVLRLLNRDKSCLSLARLGIDATRQQQLENLLRRPEGLILLTGPTGSGKTTTLYALLQHLQHDALNIMTLEDPVEYALPGIRQTAIDPPRVDFAQGVRAMLRQDPDVLLIGEIRDEETAAMALRAAQTGHRVFSTLHANDPFAALPRLHQLGLSPGSLQGSLTAIIAQRLVRRLCTVCQGPANEPAGGCPACQNTGYRGRLPLLEILPITPAIEDCLTRTRRPTRQHLQTLARAAGWQSLAEHGQERVQAGETSLDELLTVVDLAQHGA